MSKEIAIFLKISDSTTRILSVLAHAERDSRPRSQALAARIYVSANETPSCLRGASDSSLLLTSEPFGEQHFVGILCTRLVEVAGICAIVL